MYSRGWRVFLADPKELSFRAFETGTLAGLDLPRVARRGRGLYDRPRDGAGDRPRFTRRCAAGTPRSKPSRSLSGICSPLLLVIDEAGELVERLNAYHVGEDKFRDLRREAAARGEDPDQVVKPKGTKNPVLGLIWSLLRLGRQCRVYVLIATQRPDVTFIPGEARSNLNTRVGLGRLDGYALRCCSARVPFSSGCTRSGWIRRRGSGPAAGWPAARRSTLAPARSPCRGSGCRTLPRPSPAS